MRIYVITNLINGKFYVGQTVKPERERLQEHVCYSKKATTTPLARAIRKYGIANFALEVVATAESREQLNRLESLWIILTGSSSRSIGYNCTLGGDAKSLNEETKRKISLSTKGIPTNRAPINKGKPLSEETKAKISAGNKGKHGRPKPPRSPEHQAKLSLALKGHRARVWTDEDRARHSAAMKGRPSLMKGRKLSKPRKSPPHTDEHKAKISAALKGKTPKVNTLGLVPWNKGKQLSAEIRAKLSAASQKTLGAGCTASNFSSIGASTMTDLSEIRQGSRVVYAVGGVEYNAVAQGGVTFGYNAAIRGYSAFVSLAYFNEAGQVVTVHGAPLLSSEADDAFLLAAAKTAARKDPRFAYHANSDANDELVQDHIDRLKANPRTIGWRPGNADESLIPPVPATQTVVHELAAPAPLPPPATLGNAVPVTKSSGIDGDAGDWTQAGRTAEGFPVAKGAPDDVTGVGPDGLTDAERGMEWGSTEHIAAIRGNNPNPDTSTVAES